MSCGAGCKTSISQPIPAGYTPYSCTTCPTITYSRYPNTSSPLCPKASVPEVRPASRRRSSRSITRGRQGEEGQGWQDYNTEQCEGDGIRARDDCKKCTKEDIITRARNACKKCADGDGVRARDPYTKCAEGDGIRARDGSKKCSKQDGIRSRDLTQKCTEGVGADSLERREQWLKCRCEGSCVDEDSSVTSVKRKCSRKGRFDLLDGDPTRFCFGPGDICIDPCYAVRRVCRRKKRKRKKSKGKSDMNITERRKSYDSDIKERFLRRQTRRKSTIIEPETEEKGTYIGINDLHRSSSMLVIRQDQYTSTTNLPSETNLKALPSHMLFQKDDMSKYLIDDVREHVNTMMSKEKESIFRIGRKTSGTQTDVTGFVKMVSLIKSKMSVGTGVNKSQVKVDGSNSISANRKSILWNTLGTSVRKPVHTKVTATQVEPEHRDNSAQTGPTGARSNKAGIYNDFHRHRTESYPYLGKQKGKFVADGRFMVDNRVFDDQELQNQPLRKRLLRTFGQYLGLSSGQYDETVGDINNYTLKYSKATGKKKGDRDADWKCFRFPWADMIDSGTVLVDSSGRDKITLTRRLSEISKQSGFTPSEQADPFTPSEQAEQAEAWREVVTEPDKQQEEGGGEKPSASPSNERQENYDIQPCGYLEQSPCTRQVYSCAQGEFLPSCNRCNINEGDEDTDRKKVLAWLGSEEVESKRKDDASLGLLMRRYLDPDDVDLQENKFEQNHPKTCTFNRGDFNDEYECLPCNARMSSVRTGGRESSRRSRFNLQQREGTNNLYVTPSSPARTRTKPPPGPADKHHLYDKPPRHAQSRRGMLLTTSASPSRPADTRRLSDTGTVGQGSQVSSMNSWRFFKPPEEKTKRARSGSSPRRKPRQISPAKQYTPRSRHRTPRKESNPDRILDKMIDHHIEQIEQEQEEEEKQELGARDKLSLSSVNSYRFFKQH